MKITVTVEVDHMSSPEERLKMDQVLAIVGGTASAQTPNRESKAQKPTTTKATTEAPPADDTPKKKKRAKTEPKPEPESVETAITEAEVMKAIMELAQKRDKATVKELFKRFGVSRGSEIKPGDYAAVLQEIAEAL